MQMVKQSKVIDFTDEDKVESSLDFWDYRTEIELTGTFERWEDDQYSEHGVVIVDDKEIHLPNLTALSGRLKAGLVKKGDRIKIVHIGKEVAKKSGRTFENFDVFIKSS